MDIRKIKDKDLRELALKRKEEQNGTSFNLLVHMCFWWKDTPEGFDFWNKVFKKYEIKKMEEKPMDKKEMTIEQVNKLISKELDKFKGELIQKNKDYNNSLHRPNIFGQEPIEGIKARISDKLNRILSKGLDDKTEDSFRDLFGYYIHYCIMTKK